MKAARQGGRAGTQAQARVAVGTAAAGVLAYLAATGRLSGNGPSDQTTRNALYESGWRPNSVKLGDRWVSYQLFQPMSVQAALIANAFEAWAEGSADDESAVSIASQTLGRSIGSFLSQSFLSGLFDFVEAINDPERSWPRVAGRVASGMVPMSAAVRTVQQGRDPIVRQPRGIVETVEAGLPGLSESIPPRLTRFGEPVVREGGPVRRAVDPFNVSSERRDPVADELTRLGISLGVPTGRLTFQDRRLGTREQQQVIRRVQGRAVRQSLERLMATPAYRGYPDVIRHRAVETVIRRTTNAVQDQARRELIAMPAR